MKSVIQFPRKGTVFGEHQEHAAGNIITEEIVATAGIWYDVVFFEFIIYHIDSINLLINASRNYYRRTENNLWSKWG